jgi:hypothetical protein
VGIDQSEDTLLTAAEKSSTTSLLQISRISFLAANADLDILRWDEGDGAVGTCHKVGTHTECASPAVVADDGTIPDGVPEQSSFCLSVSLPLCLSVSLSLCLSLSLSPLSLSLSLSIPLRVSLCLSKSLYLGDRHTFLLLKSSRPYPRTNMDNTAR